jgi:hypothetical protein
VRVHKRRFFNRVRNAKKGWREDRTVTSRGTVAGARGGLVWRAASGKRVDRGRDWATERAYADLMRANNTRLCATTADQTYALKWSRPRQVQRPPP